MGKAIEKVKKKFAIRRRDEFCGALFCKRLHEAYGYLSTDTQNRIPEAEFVEYWNWRLPEGKPEWLAGWTEARWRDVEYCFVARLVREGLGGHFGLVQENLVWKVVIDPDDWACACRSFAGDNTDLVEAVERTVGRVLGKDGEKHE